jgi:hypothetical protein
MKIWVDRSEVQVGDIIRGSHGPGEHLPKGAMFNVVVTSKLTLDEIIPDPSQTRIFVERSLTPEIVCRPPPQKVESASDIWARFTARVGARAGTRAGSHQAIDCVSEPVASRQASMPQNFGKPERKVTFVKPERKVTTADGLTGKQCFDRFVDNMQEAVHPDGTPRRWKLTSAQKEMAQLMWRQELMLKQRAQKKLDASRAVSVVTQEDDE